MPFRTLHVIAVGKAIVSPSIMSVSYTHLDVYKRQVLLLMVILTSEPIPAQSAAA